MKILKEHNSDLLHRRRITVEIEHLGGCTPKKEDLKIKIAEKFKADVGLVSIRHIYTKYGVGMSKAIAHIYSDKKDFDYFEKKKEKKKK